MALTDQAIKRCLLTLLDQRDTASSICPSEVARALAEDEATWRGLMPRIRAMAADLQEAGKIRMTRGDQTVTRATLEGGPIRLRRPNSD